MRICVFSMKSADAHGLDPIFFLCSGQFSLPLINKVICSSLSLQGRTDGSGSGCCVRLTSRLEGIGW